MGILINAIDIGIAGTRDVVRRTMTDMMFRYEGEQTVRINAPNIFGAKLAINNAKSISQRLRKPIQKMRLYGHGGPGIQGMGRGDWSQTTDRMAAHTYDAISYANIDSLYPDIAALGRCFADDGVLEFHACSVGAGTEGDRLLNKTARYLGRSVFAGIQLQYSMGGATPNQATHRRWDTHFEGNVKGATPDGVVSYWLSMSGGYVRL